MPTQQGQQYTSANNAQDRNTLLTTGIPMRILIGKNGPYSPGQTARIKLQNVGVITNLKMRIEAQIAITGGPMQISPLAPYNFATNIVTSDYNTTQRIFAPGNIMQMLLSARHGRVWMGSGQGAVDTSQVVVPINTVSPSSSNFFFNLDLPFAYDKNSNLSGAILAQTVVGEMYLSVTFPTTFVQDITTLYTGGGSVTVTNIYITLWQEIIQPQNSALPLMDLQTVYEVAGGYISSTNLAQGQWKYLDYPNVRAVKACYLYFCNNGLLTQNETDLSNIYLIANGTTQLGQHTPQVIRQDMRTKMGGDLPTGLYYIDTRRQPIQTAIYSQVQLGILPATVNAGNTFIAWAFESMYPLNTPLPGIAQAS